MSEVGSTCVNNNGISIKVVEWPGPSRNGTRQRFFIAEKVNRTSGGEEQTALTLSLGSDMPYTLISENDATCAVAGECWPSSSEHSSTTACIFEALKCTSVHEALSRLGGSLAGRYCAIIGRQHDIGCINDPGGTQQVFYTSTHPARIYSHSELADQSIQVHNSIRTSSWHPGTATSNPEIKRLEPNHSLNINSLETSRFWPKFARSEQPLARVVDELSQILVSSAIQAAEFGRVYLALTAGWDSRVALASFCAAGVPFECFTYCYPHMSETDRDIVIAKALCEQVGVDHKVVSVPEGALAPQVLSESNGECVVVNSNLLEICRCFYAIPKLLFTPGVISGYEGFQLTHLSEIASCLSSKIDIEESYRYDRRDIFYWEQRMAFWAAPRLAPNDDHVILLNLFSNRKLIEVMLSASPKFRKGPRYRCCREVVERLRPELLDVPVNPVVSPKDRLKNAMETIGAIGTLQAMQCHMSFFRRYGFHWAGRDRAEFG